MTYYRLLTSSFSPILRIFHVRMHYDFLAVVLIITLDTQNNPRFASGANMRANQNTTYNLYFIERFNKILISQEHCFVVVVVVVVVVFFFR